MIIRINQTQAKLNISIMSPWTVYEIVQWQGFVGPSYKIHIVDKNVVTLWN